MSNTATMSHARSAAVTDFVGRERELALLLRGLEAAIEGRGQIAMVAGEAGIGKTRLLDELAARARDLGATMLWGSCDEAQSGGAYDLFRQAFDAYFRDTDEPALRSVIGTHAPVLARLKTAAPPEKRSRGASSLFRANVQLRTVRRPRSLMIP